MTAAKPSHRQKGHTTGGVTAAQRRANVKFDAIKLSDAQLGIEKDRERGDRLRMMYVVLSKDCQTLFEIVSESPESLDTFIEMSDSFQQSAEWFETAAELFSTARDRIISAMSRTVLAHPRWADLTRTINEAPKEAGEKFQP